MKSMRKITNNQSIAQTKKRLQSKHIKIICVFSYREENPNEQYNRRFIVAANISISLAK